MKKLSVYLSHPLSGLTVEEINKWYSPWILELKNREFIVYDPITMQTKLKELKTEKLGHIVSDRCDAITNDHSIYERDKWGVSQADIILVDLSGAKAISIGCTMEIGWGALLNKHVVVVMDKSNPHYHTFVLKSADVIFDNMFDAVDYVTSLNQ